MIAAHALGSDFQRLALLGDALERLFQTRARQDQIGHGGDFQRVETLGQLDDRCIAALAHGLDDLQHPRVNAVVGDAFPAQQMVQMTSEVGIGSVESANGGGSGHSGPLGWLGIGSSRLRCNRTKRRPSSGAARISSPPCGHLRISAMARIGRRGRSRVRYQC